MKDFGVERVVEPKGGLPVTAWKVDNRKKIRENEIRIRVERINVERDSFCQICSICEHDDLKIRERIIKIVSERGKLHNPYTDSGALFVGVVEEVGENYCNKDLSVGDMVVSLSTMAGIPLEIETIEEIDFYYGQIKCIGHAICFETTQLVKCNHLDENRRRYILRALDEGGSFSGIGQQLELMNIESALIIGNSIVEMAYYAQLIKVKNGNIPIVALMEKGCSCTAQLDEKSVLKVLSPLVNKVYFDNLASPLDTVKKIQQGEKRDFIDVIINLEKIKGCEIIAGMLVREKGLICYTNISNNYSQGMLIGDSLGKEILHYSLDGIYDDTYEIAEELLKDTEPVFKRLDDFIANCKFKKKNIQNARQSKTQLVAKQIDDFQYMSPVTADMVEEVLNVAQYDCNVIIQGETGVGKEKVFNLIHQNSPRRAKPCIKINCATIQESLAESEFFGYEKGSFTGAQSTGKEGYFELANNGTLFLDEIGSLSLVMQSKLLRVLQENSYYKVGGTEPKNVNVRVICANNIPLKKLVDEGKFREDLYYRLNICLIEVPPLRKRPEDIYCLANAFIKSYSKKYGVEKDFMPNAYKRLEEYHWPGNVRELENTVHRLYINQRGDTIDEEAVGDLIHDNVFEESIIDFKKELRRDENLDFVSIMEQQEKKLIEYALKKEGTTRKAAEFLGLPQTTLARKKIKYNL